MERSDQAHRDHVWHRWSRFNEIQHAAQLVEYAWTLRQRLANGDLKVELTGPCARLALTADQVGQALLREHGIPFEPNAPVDMKNLPTDQVVRQARDVAVWAESLLFPPRHTNECLHAAVELRSSAREVAAAFERSRSGHERS